MTFYDLSVNSHFGTAGCFEVTEFKKRGVAPPERTFRLSTDDNMKWPCVLNLYKT
jgi:hypothetical protein